jgi:aminobenzoyl-glutamate utilization protein A
VLRELAEQVYKSVVKYRKCIHKYPEDAFCEYRTASIVISRLKELGYEIHFGSEVNCIDAVIDSIPSKERSEEEIARAISDGAEPEYVEKMKYGKTGVVGILKCGSGPVVGIRCDMDAVRVEEYDGPDHIPSIEGFRSVYKEMNHSCGHDAHTAIGLGIAEAMAVLKAENKVKGTLKLFFEPAEELFAGGRAMVDSGIADDLTHLFAIHMAVSTKKTGQVAASVTDFPIIEKYNVRFDGKNAHADFAPEQGKNALIAACTAAIGLHAMPRHSSGNSRVNVGLLQAGSEQNLNAIPGQADMVYELVAFQSDVFDYLKDTSRSVINGAAEMYGCTAEISQNRSAVPVKSVECDSELVDLVKKATSQIPEVNEFIPAGSLRGAGEDASLFIEKAHENGGLGTYIMFGSDLSNSAHTSIYDVDNKTLMIATETMIRVLADVMKNY